MDNIEIKDASSMSEMERLEAMFKQITNKAIDNYQKELEMARAMGDEEAKRLLHIQISIFRHLQSIFSFSKQYATDARWRNDGEK